MEDDRQSKRYAYGYIVFAIVGASVARWYSRLRHWQGYLEGVQDGAAFYEAEVQQYLPWNASGEWLSDWAEARTTEEALSAEAEDFLRLKYDDA